MMKRYISAIFTILLSSQVFAAEGAVENLVLSQAPVNHYDIASIRRGAKFFATTCMACHTMRYLQYDKLAAEEGVLYEKMPFNVKAWPNGVTPPDLSLVASARGTNWIYTYLHSFYKDPNRPTGANNLLVPDSAMTNILGPYMGEQEFVGLTDAQGVYSHSVEWFDVLQLVKEGSMTPEQFDQLTLDLTNFLAYAAEPYYVEQHNIGRWVLGFLLLLTVMLYFLKKEYWRDIKHKE